MNPDHMPKNSQRDSVGLVPGEGSEEMEVFDRLPSAKEVTRWTATKRRELAEPFEKAVAFARQHAAERIARAADRGETEVEITGDALRNVAKNVAVTRVLNQLAAELIQRGFRAYVAGGDFTWDSTMKVSWPCYTPDYRRAED